MNEYEDRLFNIEHQQGLIECIFILAGESLFVGPHSKQFYKIIFIIRPIVDSHECENCSQCLEKSLPWW